MTNSTNQMDIFGQAISDYYHNNEPEDIRTETNISEEDLLPTSYLFRDFDEMPVIEQKAMSLSYGKVLDVGCAAGSHALYLQNKDLEVHGIDISKRAVDICKSRGIKHAYEASLLDWEKTKYDTILLMMNGTGIFESFERIPKYLQHLKKLLAPNGQILIDSSDIKYMYDKEELDDLYNIKVYYGELEFTIHYKEWSSEPFPWLYLDPDTFKKIAELNGYSFEVLHKGEHYDYLAKLQLDSKKL